MNEVIPRFHIKVNDATGILLSFESKVHKYKNAPSENILTHCEMVQHKRDTLTEIRASKQLSIFNRVTLRIAHYILFGQ